MKTCLPCTWWFKPIINERQIPVWIWLVDAYFAEKSFYRSAVVSEGMTRILLQVKKLFKYKILIYFNNKERNTGGLVSELPKIDILKQILLCKNLHESKKTFHNSVDKMSGDNSFSPDKIRFWPDNDRCPVSISSHGENYCMYLKIVGWMVPN